MKKKILTVVIAGLMSLSCFTSAFAGQWQQDPTTAQWKYLNDAGTYYTNGWQWIDGNGDGIAECYYFDANGICLINTVTPDNYTVDANGAWTINGVVQTQAVAIAQPSIAVEQTTDVVLTTEESNWTGSYPFVSGMQTTLPSTASFWTVNINTGKYHGTPYVDKLLPENTRYYTGDFSVLDANGYSRCQKNGCH